MVHGNNNYLKIDARSNRVGAFNSILLIIATKKHTKTYKKFAKYNVTIFFTEQMNLHN